MMSKRELLFQVRRKDLRIDTFKAGGRGGQHQNKTDSGVRITHIETGISAECRDDRSQHRNRATAFRKLAKLLVAHYTQEEQRARFPGSDKVVRTYHAPDDRIVDHDTGARYSYRQVIEKGKGIEVMIETRARDMAARDLQEGEE
jgi:peptide chain release factor 1